MWAVLLEAGGRELARIPLIASKVRDVLPLRELASEGLRRDAAGLVVIRVAADGNCIPCAREMDAVHSARRTLGLIGLRLHDYILWHGERSVSLRQAGKL